MTAALAHWGRGLIILALFGLLAEMLLPSRATEGYVRLVIGLVILAAVIAPVLGLVRGAVGSGLSALSGGPADAASLSGLLRAEGSVAGGQGGLVAQVFATEVGRTAVAQAESVRGVAAARAHARVDVANGLDYGQLRGVDVAVVLRPGVDPASALAAVRRRVASALGLAPGAVGVTAGRGPPAGSAR